VRSPLSTSAAAKERGSPNAARDRGCRCTAAPCAAILGAILVRGGNGYGADATFTTRRVLRARRGSAMRRWSSGHTASCRARSSSARRTTTAASAASSGADGAAPSAAAAVGFQEGAKTCVTTDASITTSRSSRRGRPGCAACPNCNGYSRGEINCGVSVFLICSAASARTTVSHDGCSQRCTTSTSTSSPPQLDEDSLRRERCWLRPRIRASRGECLHVWHEGRGTIDAAIRRVMEEVAFTKHQTLSDEKRHLMEVVGRWTCSRGELHGHIAG
jgi:hypothetical protein